MMESWKLFIKLADKHNQEAFLKWNVTIVRKKNQMWKGSIFIFRKWRMER